jgi:hypothetical protein
MFNDLNVKSLKSLAQSLGDVEVPAKKADIVALLESECAERGLVLSATGDALVPAEPAPEAEEPEAGEPVDEEDGDESGTDEGDEPEGDEESEEGDDEAAEAATPQKRRVPKAPKVVGRRAEHAEHDVIHLVEGKSLSAREGSNRAARFAGVREGMTIGQYLDHAFAANGEHRARHRYHGDVRKLKERGYITVSPGTAPAATPAVEAEAPTPEADAA